MTRIDDVFFMLGRKVQCGWKQEPHTLNRYHDWTFPTGAPFMVHDFEANPAVGIVTPMTSWRAQGTGTLDLFVFRAGDYPFRTVLTYNTQHEAGKTAERTGTLRIVAPTVVTEPPTTTPPTIIRTAGPRGPWDTLTVGGPESPGFAVAAQVRLPTVPGELVGGPGWAAFVQLISFSYHYDTFDGRGAGFDTGAEYLLDASIPYDRLLEPNATTGVRVPFVDWPSVPLPPEVIKTVRLRHDFKTYLIYLANEIEIGEPKEAIYTPLARIDWRVSARADRAAPTAPWALAARDIGAGAWVTSGVEMPTWTRNANVCDALIDDALKQLLSADEYTRYKGHGVIPVAEIRKHRSEYRAYIGAFSGVKADDYKRDFQAQFDCVINIIGSTFQTWLLPDVAARARSFRNTTALTEVQPDSKWLPAKGSYQPPFGWETEWNLSVAPLCFTPPGDQDVANYWRLFATVSPASIVDALEGRLPRMRVTCGAEIRSGVFTLTFSRPLWGEDLVAIADFPWVYYVEPKEHFGEKLLNMVVYVAAHGDVVARNDFWIGERGAGQIEGFLIDPMQEDITLEYMGHVAGTGDTPWYKQRVFLGGRGGGKAVEGFAIRLTGAAASKYALSYRAWLQGTGDTGVTQAGDFCGTKGQSRPVQAMLVSLRRKDGGSPAES